MVKAGFYWVFPSIVTTITIVILVSQLQITYSQSTFQIARPSCPEKCGEVEIPYPFGIGDNCHYNHPNHSLYYNITCNQTRVPVVPTYGNIEIEKITLDGEFRVRNYISYICYDSEGAETQNFTSWIRITRFALSTTKNIAAAIGCDTMGLFAGTRMNSNNIFTTGCVTVCSNQSDVSNRCSGIGCCLAAIPDGVTNIRFFSRSIDNHTTVHSFNPCSVAFVVAQDSAFEDGKPFSVNSVLSEDLGSLRTTRTPMVYDWSMGTKDCEEARAAEEYICKGNSRCIDNIQGQWGYRCQCNPGFQGNPYLHDCQGNSTSLWRS